MKLFIMLLVTLFLISSDKQSISSYSMCKTFFFTIYESEHNLRELVGVNCDTYFVLIILFVYILFFTLEFTCR